MHRIELILNILVWGAVVAVILHARRTLKREQIEHGDSKPNRRAEKSPDR